MAACEKKIESGKVRQTNNMLGFFLHISDHTSGQELNDSDDDSSGFVCSIL